MKSSNATLIKALRILANEIKSPDDVPALCLREAAERINELHTALVRSFVLTAHHPDSNIQEAHGVIESALGKP